MVEIFFKNTNLIQLLVFLTFGIAVFCLNLKQISHKFLLAILTCSFFNEFMTFLCIISKVDYSLLYSISAIIHNGLWLILLYSLTTVSKLFEYLIVIYFCFAVMNLFMFEGLDQFNNFTFVTGAFLYLIFFIIISFRQLKIENFTFFYSNNYLLLFAPVFFFLGLSFYFGFRNSDLGDIEIIGDMSLYKVIIYFVNIIYYGSLILFILLENKIKHAK